jgi:hypothetical protein
MVASDSIVIARRDGQPELKKSIGALLDIYLGEPFHASVVNEKRLEKWMIFELDKAKLELDKAKFEIRVSGTGLLLCCAAFARNELALAQSKSANKESVSSSLSEFTVALPISSTPATSFAQMCDNFTDIGDKDDSWLLAVMQQWWAHGEHS